MKKYLWPTLLFAFIIGHAEAQIIDVDGVPLTLRVLRGYCNDHDARLLSALEQMAIRRKPITVSAPCDELEGFKAGTVERLQRYLVWSVEATDRGGAFKLPSSITRAQFVAGVAGEVGKTDWSKVFSESQKKLSREGLKAQMKDPGVIDRDDEAIYFASIASLSDNTLSKDLAVVMGMAAIHHFSLSLVAYDEFRDSTTFSDLLGVVKLLMRAALQDNPD